MGQDYLPRSRDELIEVPADTHYVTNRTERSNSMTIHIVLPGYAPRPVGGYRVVYEYASWMATNLDENIMVHHVPYSDARYTRPLTINHIKGLASRELLRVIQRPRKRGLPWFSTPSELDCRFGISTLGSRLRKGDVVIATAVQTAHYVAKVLARRDGVVGVNFIQHVETWSTRAAIVEAAWRLPLHRIVIAPWLQEYGESRGLSSLLAPNAIDPSTFPPGPPLAQRGETVVAMLSDAPFKRPDVVIAALTEIQRLRPATAVVGFGVGPRPQALPGSMHYVRCPSRGEVADLYRSARVYLCGSDAEGWHLPPAEALLSGASVVSTDIGGVRAYAEDAALFSARGDGLALARNALELMGDTVKAQGLVETGRTRLLGYSPEDAARRFSDCVLGVVNQAQGTAEQ